jgi:hypothetical protein
MLVRNGARAEVTSRAIITTESSSTDTLKRFTAVVLEARL